MPSTPKAPYFLIVDDEVDLCLLVQTALERSGYQVRSAYSVAQAMVDLRLAASQGRPFTAVISDLRLGDTPAESGLALTEHVQARYPGTPISIMTAHGSTQNAVDALKAGAFDYLTKPVSIGQLRALAAQMCAVAIATKPMVATSPVDMQVRSASTTADSPAQAIISGRSPAMLAVQAQLTQLARTQSPVVLEGESGTGKELAARALHQLGARQSHPFIAVNCGAIPETLIEAELFGVKKGAFTGANTDRDGVFHAAHQGTLLLDEIGDLPLNMQVKLLRVLQEKSVRRVGSTSEEPVDVRIIAASHKSLPDLVAAGTFRQDLYYRLSVMNVHLPPLRERGADCVMLAQRYLQRAQPDGAPSLDASAQAWLSTYQYPGNVRELENLMERAMAMCDAQQSSVIDDSMFAQVERKAAHIDRANPVSNSIAHTSLNTVESPALPATAHTAAPTAAVTFPLDLTAHLAAIEKTIIEAALLKVRYNRSTACELLGLNARQLRYRIEQLGIE